MAHNGELNTDKKNRLSEAAVASAKRRAIVRPPGQSDSCRLDQTLEARVIEDSVDLVTAVVSMMPPAWENDTTLSPAVRAMFEYFSLYEEKNDGPAALVFGDGTIIGARWIASVCVHYARSRRTTTCARSPKPDRSRSRLRR